MTFKTADGARVMESLRLDGRNVLQVSSVHGALKATIPARVIRQYRGEQLITLLAPVTIQRLAAAGVPEADLRTWGLAL